MFGLTEDELDKLSPEQLADLNRRMDFVRLAMPSEWQSYANELMRSAELLWESRENRMRIELLGLAEVVDGTVVRRQTPGRYYSISRPYVLLAGFALENLLKGMLVSGNPEHITSGELSDDLRSHRILDLIDKVGDISLDEHEERFCQIAQSAIPYWGRYPIPLNKNQIMREVGMDDDLRNAFISLFTRLARRLHESTKDGWDSGVGARMYKRRDASMGDMIDLDEPFFD